MITSSRGNRHDVVEIRPFSSLVLKLSRGTLSSRDVTLHVEKLHVKLEVLCIRISVGFFMSMDAAISTSPVSSNPLVSGCLNCFFVVLVIPVVFVKATRLQNIDSNSCARILKAGIVTLEMLLYCSDPRGKLF